MAQTTTLTTADEHRSGDRSLTDRWYIEATRKDANTVEVVDLIASHNKHRKTIDIDLRRVAVDGISERFTVRLLAGGNDTTNAKLHRMPCPRYSAKQLDAAMSFGREKLAELIAEADSVVAELFRDTPHY